MLLYVMCRNESKPCLTPSSYCCAGHAEVVKLLVKANALVDKANQKGTTALMRATQEGNEEVVGILVSAGADVSKRNNERMNALMLGSQVRGRYRLFARSAVTLMVRI